MCHFEVRSVLHWNQKCATLKWEVCCIEVRSMLHWIEKCGTLVWEVCYIKTRNMVFWSEKCAVLKWEVYYIEVRSMLFWSEKCATLKWEVCCIEVRSLLHRIEKCVKLKWGVWCIEVRSVMYWRTLTFLETNQKAECENNTMNNCQMSFAWWAYFCLKTKNKTTLTIFTFMRASIDFCLKRKYTDWYVWYSDYNLQQ